MAEITVAMINDLRTRTNAGMMDCKKALIQTQGDMDAAIKILREKGLAIQVKRADKESKQGIIAAAAAADGTTLALVEVNCETDFVAKTDRFKAFVADVAQKVLTGDLAVAETLKNDLVAIIAATGENLKIRRVARFAATATTRVESYIHLGGKVGVLVEVACGKPETPAHPAVAEMIHDLALQVAAANPRYVKSSEVPAADIEAEKDIYRKQVEGKPANIVESILKGKIQKFFSEICLIDQPFVKEPKQTITQVVNDAAKKAGDTITVTRFVRFQLGAA
ncbi:MAG: translation elongation factor Ts [Lentisphaerae bacterium]|nr:translation elongation factor Ts [Lentisphaerota bacterium]